MTTQIDARYPEAGFVMVHVGTSDEKRMVYAPYHTVTRTASVEGEALVLSDGNWGPLTDKERTLCKKALQQKFPGREIVVSV